MRQGVGGYWKGVSEVFEKVGQKVCARGVLFDGMCSEVWVMVTCWFTPGPKVSPSPAVGCVVYPSTCPLTVDSSG